MTGGMLEARGLATTATIPPPGPPPCRTGLREPAVPDARMPSLVLLTCEDLSLETELDLEAVRGIIVLHDPAASEADRTALADAASRAARHWRGGAFEEAAPADLADIAVGRGCTQIVTGFAATGPVADVLDTVRPGLAGRGIALAEHQRRWDRLAWPFCARGFFQLKSRIPALLLDQGIIGRD
jgi:deoxyribodipyrimidine photo-lyase